MGESLDLPVTLQPAPQRQGRCTQISEERLLAFSCPELMPSQLRVRVRGIAWLLVHLDAPGRSLWHPITQYLIHRPGEHDWPSPSRDTTEVGIW